MSQANIVRLLVLSEWGLDDQEIESVNTSGIGPIVEVDLTSFLEPRNENSDGITAASYSSPASTLRGGCAGAGGGGHSDGGKQAEVGYTDLGQSGKPVELVHRVTA
jgi:hypothetical protein